MENKKDTLVILTPGFAASELDTNCLPMQQAFVKALKKNYPRLHIIILSFQYPYFKKEYQWFDTTVISFNGQNKGSVSKLLLRKKLNNVLDNLNRSNSIVGILSFWYGECALVGKRFADKNNLKHLCWILGQDAKKENKYPELIAAPADELVALSDFLQDEFEKNHHIRPKYLVPAGVTCNKAVAPVAQREIDMLGVGSLITLKHFEIFIEVFVTIEKQLSGLKAILVGDGPEKNKLQALINKLGVKDKITLAGELPHEEVLSLMSRSKILLHPSSYEGFSGVCLEALSQGAHVISFTRAMKEDTRHWHIVQDKGEMEQQAISILHDPNIDYEKIILFEMDAIAVKMARLFL